MGYALIWWVVSARHWFKGPKVNIQHQMLGREDNVLEGKVGQGSTESISNHSGEFGINNVVMRFYSSV